MGLTWLTLMCLAAYSPQDESLRIDSVIPAADQPIAGDPALIWFDDFDGPARVYTESIGEVDRQNAFGGDGGSMPCRYPEGGQGIGNRKVFFGDSPSGKVVRKGERFDDVYWRVYVKHQPGWAGGGEDKLSRITSITSPKWAQAMIGHVWTTGQTLTLDPASGVEGDRVVTTRYNDFSKLHWLGNRPSARTQLSSRMESGWWTCVEARVKLNTPGQKDGSMSLWIDGRLESERQDLDWRGAYDGHGLNAVFLEAYWNKGSPVAQSRWLDNFVIATKPIGPVVAPRSPTLLLGGIGAAKDKPAWQVEVSDIQGTVVWRSSILKETSRTTVSLEFGAFDGPRSGFNDLAGEATYYVRVRRCTPVGSDGVWSPWHQGFRTASN